MAFYLTLILYYTSAPADYHYIQYGSFSECNAARVQIMAEPVSPPVSSRAVLCSSGRRPGETDAERRTDKAIRDVVDKLTAR